MASADVQGKFLWHELLTTDPGTAGAFYGKVLGWTPQAWDRDPSYTVLLTPKGPVGGMTKPGPDMQGVGATPQWLSYIGTTHLEETVSAAQRHGGRVLKGAADIPGGGRYAVLADPQGAVFGIYTPPASSSGGGHTDAFTWHELATSDHAAALRFYRELFGWEQLGVREMGSMGPYVLFGRGGQQLGGMFTRGGAGFSGTAPHWLAYVRVSSAAKAAETAKSAGGRVINGPRQVPGDSWIVQLADPQGAVIAVNQPAGAESALPSKPAAPAAPAATSAAAPAKPAAPASGAQPAASASKPAPAVSPATSGATKAAGSAAKPSAEGGRMGAMSGRGAPGGATTTRAAGRSGSDRGGASGSRATASARRGSAAKKGAARKAPAKKAAAKKAATKKAATKKGPAARSARGAGRGSARRSAGARGGSRRGAAGAKSARGKTARKKAGRR